MKALQKFKQDPRVKDAWDEGEDGLWILLKPGFYNAGFDTGVHAIHERTVKECAALLKQVKPCQCPDCAS